MFFFLLIFLKRRLCFLIIFFASLVNQKGSDCLILTFLLGMSLSASSEIRLVILDAYMSISLTFSDSQSVSRMSRDRERILTLSANLGIFTLRRAIQELSRFSFCAEHIYIYIYIYEIVTCNKGSYYTLQRE